MHAGPLVSPPPGHVPGAGADWTVGKSVFTESNLPQKKKKNEKKMKKKKKKKKEKKRRKKRNERKKHKKKIHRERPKHID